MNPIKFRKEKKNGLFHFHYTPTGKEVLIEKTFLDNKSVSGGWADSEVNNLYSLYNINNSGSLENRAIYLGLIWDLVRSHSLFGSAIWDTADVIHFYNKNYEFVKWEYKVDHEYINTTLGHIVKDGGFESARSPQIDDPSNSFPDVPRDTTGLFELLTFTDLADLQRAGLGDVSSLVNLYALKETEKSDLLKFLRQNQMPNLADILKPGEVFIALSVGVDLGYYDYLLIVTPDDLGERLASMALKYENFTREYEVFLESATSLKQLEEKFKEIMP